MADTEFQQGKNYSDLDQVGHSSQSRHRAYNNIQIPQQNQSP